jgi:hypothetical protein
MCKLPPCKMFLFLSFFLFFFFFWVTGVWTQAHSLATLARQALYCLSHSACPCYLLLYKGPKHPEFWYLREFLEPIPWGYCGTIILFLTFSMVLTEPCPIQGQQHFFLTWMNAGCYGHIDLTLPTWGYMYIICKNNWGVYFLKFLLVLESTDLTHTCARITLQSEPGNLSFLRRDLDRKSWWIYYALPSFYIHYLLN